MRALATALLAVGLLASACGKYGPPVRAGEARKAAATEQRAPAPAEEWSAPDEEWSAPVPDPDEAAP